MKSMPGCRSLCQVFFAALLILSSPLARADKWMTPTPEELSMTSQPEVPGAAAVYLYREEITEDNMHVLHVYERLKVLTESGKKYANVELGYSSSFDNGSISIEEIEGRTIHPDGTIIPFIGKAYQKLIEKTRGAKYMAKVFTLPDVEVGSIIEYRYDQRLDDNYFMAPRWYIQSDLYTRKAHYVWKPTSKPLISNDGHGNLTNTIAWTPILPPGAELQHSTLPAVNFNPEQQVFELNVHDIAPVPNEDYMPPTSSLSYRVLFYYTPYRNGLDFWKNQGKYWSKMHDKFIGPGPGVEAAVKDLTLPTDTQEQKLRKLYAAVMQLENTDFTREHSSAEEKAAGSKPIRSTDDVWERKRGSSDQLSDLFVAMARAAGMKAYVAAVTNRDRNVFLPNYLSLAQLDDDLAIVSVDGKEQYFDPGSRFCPYGQLAWKHSFAEGLRQTDDGTAVAKAPGEPYTASRIQRVGDLNMDEHGVAGGQISMTYIGAYALYWRQRSLKGDATSLEHDLRTTVEELLPAGMDVKVASIEKLADYEQPLRVTFMVHGEIGSSTGKRLIIPADVFEVNSKPSFPHEKREVPVYFDYAFVDQDAVRVNFPASLKVESMPPSDKVQLQSLAAYDIATASTPTSVTVRHNYSLGTIIFLPKEYSDLRSFYSKMETDNQGSVVLISAAKSAGNSTTAAN
ncbi:MULTISPECIES: DUF3857 domain-containing protein [Acidobacteriaceae]|uniref:DUF3857 domain-containing protein n=1 Tax=Acidobacteriaceae TaxID=204434 RepID=UPI0020B137E1|nr:MULTISPECIES: DUF3857 domain-containing protein [Acidobacteriaceae]MDW5264803.1 DUF3857 domain-containing protein [Edaphobacter sp.]